MPPYADVARSRSRWNREADGGPGEGHRSQTTSLKTACLNTNSPGARSDGSMTPNPVRAARDRSTSLTLMSVVPAEHRSLSKVCPTTLAARNTETS